MFSHTQLHALWQGRLASLVQGQLGHIVASPQLVITAGVTGAIFKWLALRAKTAPSLLAGDYPDTSACCLDRNHPWIPFVALPPDLGKVCSHQVWMVYWHFAAACLLHTWHWWERVEVASAAQPLDAQPCPLVSLLFELRSAAVPPGQLCLLGNPLPAIRKFLPVLAPNHANSVAESYATILESVGSELGISCKFSWRVAHDVAPQRTTRQTSTTVAGVAPMDLDGTSIVPVVVRPHPSEPLPSANAFDGWYSDLYFALQPDPRDKNLAATFGFSTDTVFSFTAPPPQLLFCLKDTDRSPVAFPPSFQLFRCIYHAVQAR